ncbi:RNA-directed DNA polymerase, eukaryota, reverse transcriptase zinc-binding domain protein, partial [Tanacetum coccineum]
MIFVSVVYGEISPKARTRLWRDLVEYKGFVNNNPWVVLGDFNVVLRFNENSNGLNIQDAGIKDFRECIDSLELEDINMTELFYTWIQKMRNPELGVLKKLDRIMGNAHFISKYANSFAVFMPYLTSDHSPAILTIPDLAVRRSRSFRFANFLADKADFVDIIRENWDIDVKGYKMFKLARKLKNMKKYMRQMNRRNGNVFEKVKVLKDELSKIQCNLDKDPTNAVLKEEEMVYYSAYREAALDEEKLLKQKTKIEWLRDGDFNSSYFHSVVKGRTSRNRIEMVLDDSGNAHYGDNVTNMFVSHFEKNLGTQDVVYEVEDAVSLFTKRLDADKAMELIKDVTNEEIKEAIFSIDDNKASGPDGFSSKFFKAAWVVIGNDVCAAIKEFFTSGKLLGEFNTTLISLVPKSKTPARVIDYRPISCCNIVYKGISKVITNRLKTVKILHQIRISNNADIDEEVAEDQSVTAQFMAQEEIANVMNNDPCQEQDIIKAYDTVSWSFLEFCLKEFGFHPVMINWIMVCLKTASFSVCVNGESHGFFKAKRGLRQGDPISPYLFTLVMEVLNLMVKRQIKRDSRFKYHTGCSKLKITSLCFADDLLMLCHGDVVSASILRRGLDEFSLASGLYPSMSKSEAFFSNVCPDAKNEILMAMPFREGTLPIRYLGVPLASRRIKASDCRVLIDAVKNRINDWRNKSLSFAGRLQLISSILSSLQVYWCSLFILPKLICETIDKMVKNFLWAREGNTSGMVSIGWKEVCKPKSQGGLGLKPLCAWNEALMAKHLWNIASNKDSIW